MPAASSGVPLHLNPKPSRSLYLTLAIVHGGAMMLVMVLPLTLLWRLDLICLLGISLARQWPRVARLPTVVWETDGRWLWQVPGRLVEVVALQGDTVVTRWLVLLCFRTVDGGLRTLLLPGDALEASTLRQLRVRLRLEAVAAAQTPVR